MCWDKSLLFLKFKDHPNDNDNDSFSTSATLPAPGSGNLRVMVPDVDAKYEECKQLGCEIQQEIGDRKFVLRDFVVNDPDGFGVRFGSFLEGRGKREQERGPEDEIVHNRSSE